jgi:uncharacterized repeat protein (TIGR01451 family)
VISGRAGVRGALGVAAVVGALLFGAAPASAASPHWTMITQAAPTYFHLGDTSDFYEIMAANDGAVDTSGAFKVTDTLPAGITVNAASGLAERHGLNPTATDEFGCEETSFEEMVTVTCTTGTNVPVGRSVVININVSVPANASGTLDNEASISGGGAPEGATSSTETPLAPESQPVPYGSTLAGDMTDSSGAGATQAGSHPFAFTTLLDLNVGSVNPNERCNENTTPSCANLNTQAKDIEVATPPGFVGNPTAWPQCTQAQFERVSYFPCPASTQVGSAYLRFYTNGTAVQYAPVYNIVPPPGQPAELGFSVSAIAKVPIFFHLRSDGDYGLSSNVSSITQFDPPRMVALSIWGEPSDEAHNAQRLGQTTGCGPGSGGCPSGVLNPKPFLTLPTSCADATLPLYTGGDSWQEPLPQPFPIFESTTLPGMNGCNQLEFEPTLEARPTTNLADAPSGLHVDLHVPQPETIGGLGEADLKDTKVTLPKGLTLNPSSAAGLEGCSPAQLGLTSGLGVTPIRTTATPANCPNGSKLGSVEVKTPLIKDPLEGAVYLAKPYANPFNSLLALYITVNDPKTNIVVKLAAKVEVSADGQLTTTVTESPQVPFTDFKLDFFNGARAPLRTPSVCATYSTTSELTPYSAPESGPPATPSDSYAVSSGPGGGPCAGTQAAEPNKPSFEAGTQSPLSGTYSPFALHLHREDGSQVFSALNVNLPPGLVGKLAGTPYCPEAALAAAAKRGGSEEQASPSCPAASRIGSVSVGAGAGPAPYYAQGTAYLTGPYKGAPLSVSVITPALAGPFDLGTVVLRNALYVNPETAQISVKSDPIPTQLQGIQLDIRSIDFNVDRPQFTLNPTNCEKFAVSGSETSSLGNVAALSDPFQVGECGRLAFKPKLAINLKGDTKRAGHPALKATLTYPKSGSYANVASAQVTLPHAEFLDNSHIKTVCTRVQFAAEQCPAASVYGYASATSPLLEGAVQGPVYLRSSNHKLPDLVAALNGQIDVDLAGRIDTGKGGGIRNTFEVVPDAPVSKFTLSMKGGKKGLLVNSENLCETTSRAIADFTAQNGKVSDTEPVITNSCKKAKKAKRGGHHGRH